MSEASRLGAISAFLLKHRASPVFRSRREPAPGIEPEGPSESAESFTRDLEALGPTFVKIGQMLSTRPDLVPPEYQLALARLQDDATQAPLADITGAIEKGLGAPLNKLFAQFDPVPVGTASFAQVHRAVLPSGRQVAVKVQRPDLAAQVRWAEQTLEQHREVLAVCPAKAGGSRFEDKLAGLDHGNLTADALLEVYLTRDGTVPKGFPKKALVEGLPGLWTALADEAERVGDDSAKAYLLERIQIR